MITHLGAPAVVRARKSASPATVVYDRQLCTSSLARPVTHRPSRLSWPGSGFRALDSGDREPDRPQSSRTVPTPPGPSARISDDAASGPSSRSPPTRSDTASGEAVLEAARPASTPWHTKSAIPSNAASPDSINGAAWPCEPTNLPVPSRPQSTCRRPYLDPQLTKPQR